MRRLFLARHAPARWPEGTGDPRYRGWSEAPLSESGRREAELLARRLARSVGPDIGSVYASDLARVASTAAPFSALSGVPVTVREGLRELSFGEWEGRSHSELEEWDGERYGRWLADPMRSAPPGGETLLECRDRAWAVIEESRTRGAGDILVFGHGGPLRLILCRLLGMPPGNHWRLRLDHSGLTTLDLADPPILTRFNDRSHLPESP